MDNNAHLPQEGSVRLLCRALPRPGMKGEITHQGPVLLYLPRHMLFSTLQPSHTHRGIDALALNSTLK